MEMRRTLSLFASICLGLSAVGCVGNFPRHASPQIEDSFSSLDVQDGHVTLQRRALGQAFLVTPVLYASRRTPVPVHGQPRVVSFELQGDTLAMLERNLHAVYGELPSERLLQTFAVTQKTAESVTFSWHMGLEILPVGGGWVASDLEGTTAQGLQEPATVRTKRSFLRSAALVDNGLELEQVSQVEHESLELAAAGLPPSCSVTVRTRITPYEINPHFDARHSTQQQGVGYFEVAHGVPGTLAPEVLAMRWDARPEAGPVTYLISRHTPAQLVQPMADGILYWNRVAGRELVRVQRDADPNQPPRRRQVMLHWLQWHDGMQAETGLQADPVTGELLHGSIYLPAAIADLGSLALPGITPNVELVPQGFASGNACGMPRVALSAQLETQVRQDRSAQARVAADFLRYVVAHEVGHSLGLRHNFAGSGQSTLADPVSLRMALQEYLRHPNAAGAVTSSSVMDYLPADDAVLLGAAMRRAPLAYDAAALQWGYSQVPVQVQDLQPPPFCTDGQARERILGCSRFDSGAQPIASFAGALAQHAQLGARLMLQLLQAMHPLAGAPRTAASAAALVAEAGADLQNVGLASAAFAHLARGSKVLQVEQALGDVAFVDPAAYRRATALALGEAAEQAGGLPGLLAAAYPMDDAATQNRPRTGWLGDSMLAALRNPEASARLEATGVSAAERHSLERYLGAVGAVLEQKLLHAMLQALTGGNIQQSLEEVMAGAAPNNRFAEGVVRPTWEPPLADLGRHILFDTVGNDSGNGSGPLPRPRFTLEVRLAATRLFSERLFGTQGWAQRERVALLTDLQQRRETEALRPAMRAEPVSDNADRARWLHEELQVINALQLID